MEKNNKIQTSREKIEEERKCIMMTVSLLNFTNLCIVGILIAHYYTDDGIFFLF